MSKIYPAEFNVSKETVGQIRAELLRTKYSAADLDRLLALTAQRDMADAALR